MQIAKRLATSQITRRYQGLHTGSHLHIDGYLHIERHLLFAACLMGRIGLELSLSQAYNMMLACRQGRHAVI